MSKELAKTEKISVEEVLKQAIDKNVSVETMERLLAMRRELKQEAAKEAYDRAMAEFQSECPTIKKIKEVKNRNGELLYSYAPIESIIQQVAPILKKYGFSYSFDTKTNGSISATCTVTHELGHSKDSTVSVPAGQGSIMSEAQKVASSITFAKRYAFCNAFGIMTGDEDDDNRIAAPEEPKMAPYRVERVVNEEDVIDDGQILSRGEIRAVKKPRDDAPKSLGAQKAKIVSLLIKMGRKTKTKKDCEDSVFDLTDLVLSAENYDQIIDRLSALAEEAKEKYGA